MKNKFMIAVLAGVAYVTFSEKRNKELTERVDCLCAKMKMLEGRKGENA